ncbi:MAG: phasin family protein, partial [Burkholderiaceae bacterium]
MTTQNTVNPQQLAAAYQSNLETLFALSQTAFEGVEKVVTLNLNVAKANMQDSADQVRQMLSVEDPPELLRWTAHP